MLKNSNVLLSLLEETDRRIARMFIARMFSTGDKLLLCLFACLVVVSLLLILPTLNVIAAGIPQYPPAAGPVLFHWHTGNKTILFYKSLGSQLMTDPWSYYIMYYNSVIWLDMLLGDKTSWKNEAKAISNIELCGFRKSTGFGA